MTIPKDAKEDECDDRVKIAKAYLTSWFFIDALSILPFDIIMQIAGGMPLAVCPPDTENDGGKNNSPLNNMNLLFFLCRLVDLLRSSIFFEHQ